MCIIYLLYLPCHLIIEIKLFLFLFFNNSNTIVQIRVNISMKNRKSVLGINSRYLAFKYKIKSNYWHEDWKHIERAFLLTCMLRLREVIVIIMLVTL